MSWWWNLHADNFRTILTNRRYLGRYPAWRSDPIFFTFTEYDGSTTSAPAPTESEAEKIKEKTMEIADKVATELGIPTWGLVAIVIGICVVILGICFCCIRRCCRKRRGKDGKKGMKGVDLKSVQLLGSAYKEKVFIFSWVSIIKKILLDGL